MKTFSLPLFFCLAALAMFLVACGSDSSTSNSEVNNVLDISADTMGFDLGTDTLLVYWHNATLVVAQSAAAASDSLAIRYRVEGSTDWKYYKTFGLTKALSFSLTNSESYAFEVDYQLTLLRSSGETYVADSLCAALTDRELAPAGSSSSNGSSSNASSSSSISSSSAASSSSGYNLNITAGTWTGDYTLSSSSGTYYFTLYKDKSITELFFETAATGKCTEYTGTWTQDADNHRFLVTRTKKTVNPRLDEGCSSLIESSENLSGSAVAYPVVFSTDDATLIYLTIPELGGKLLSN
jgi:hypothetical protein